MQNLATAPTEVAPISKKKKVLWAVLAILTNLVLLIVLLIQCLHFLKPVEKPVEKPAAVVAAPQIQDRPDNGSVQDGGLDLGNATKTKAQLQSKADKSNMNMTFNAHPGFVDGQAKGSIMIDNGKESQHLMQVKVIEDGTGRVLYISPVVKPGQSIQSDRLSVDLPKGVYKATGHLQTYNPLTEQPDNFAFKTPMEIKILK